MYISFNTLQTDALVIGSGLSGLMAAYTLKLPPDMRLSIISTGSGASPHVIGFNLPLHKADSVECFIDDTLISGHFQNDEKLVKTLCSDSLELISILKEIGFELDQNGDQYALRQPLGASYPRVAGEGNVTGHSIMKKISKVLQARDNVTTLKSLRALRLKTSNGKIQGVFAYDMINSNFIFIKTKVVILACGGFCNIYPFSTNTGDIGGDGIAMAYHAGASLIDLEFVQFEPTAAVYPEPIRGLGVSTTLCHEGAVLRNINGEQFMLKYGPDGEQVNKDIMSKLIYQEIQDGKGTPKNGVYFDATKVGRERLDKAYDLFVKRYAKYGIDIATEYMEVAPAAHTSLGGVEISKDCATTVSGLYACGELVGGVHGANRIGGNAGLETMVFGRRAGMSASNYLEGFNSTEDESQFQDELKNWVCDTIQIENTQTSETISEEQMISIRNNMKNLLSENVNVIREGKALKFTADELARYKVLLEKSCVTNNNQEIFIKFRLHNDLTTAYLLTLAALERPESKGCHIRSDSIGDSAHYRIKVSKGIEAPILKKETIISRREVIYK